MTTAGDVASSVQHDTPAPALGRLGTAFVWVARIEAMTWLGLLIGMAFKYVLSDNEIGVKIFGPLHGAAFVSYVALTLAVAVSRRWSVWLTLVALGASIPPLMTWPFERYAVRTGRLTPR